MAAIRQGLLLSCLLALGLAAPVAAPAAESAPVTSPRVTATLISSRDVATPGEKFQVAIVERIAPHWHTYWVNPGDSGEPTKIEWTLPAGFAAGEIQWPAPKPIPVTTLVNYGFEEMLVLPVEISVPAEAKPGDRLPLRAKATWLVCEKICIPEEGAFALDLTIGETPKIDAAAQDRIAQARAALPKPASFRARIADKDGALDIALPGLPADAANVHFYPFSDTLIDHAAPQTVRNEAGIATVEVARSSSFVVKSDTTGGVLTFTQNGGPQALTIGADVDKALVTAAPAAATEAVAAPLSKPAAGDDLTFWTALLFAFAGGLVLNLMPCVLPVLFIKALGFANLAQASPAAVRRQGLLFLAGVLATFLLLGGAVIALGAIGSGIGWGFQLQSPPVVIGLAVVMALIGFNLLGAFEVGTSVQGVGSGLADRGGALGSFMTGALAVVVATPCTAPFMGAAMGFALTQPPALALAVFAALALGFALPVVALSYMPGWLRFLPKPGRWMMILKQAFAFPMFGTAVWLIWVASVQAGSIGVLAALIAVLAAGFVVWLIGVTRTGSGGLRSAAAAAAVVVALATGAFVVQAAQPGQPQSSDQSWSADKVAALQAEGRPVFVNFTAAWCITCLANERVALSRPEVKDGFAKLNVAYLKGDWTNRDAAIAKLLADHGRAGVPLYLFYPGRKGAEAEILPQLLSADMVIAAAERAAQRELKTATR